MHFWLDEIHRFRDNFYTPARKKKPLPADFSVDFRCPARYAEKRHKDDKAVPTKKWKYL